MWQLGLCRAVIIHLHLASFQFRFPLSLLALVTLLFFVHELLPTFQTSLLSLLQRWSRWRIIWSRFSLARNFSPDSSFPNLDSRKTSSLSQFIGFARRDRSKNRQINSLPINRLLSNDQLSPVLLFLPPYSTPLSSSNEAETLEPVPLHSHPSIHPFIPRREIEK